MRRTKMEVYRVQNYVVSRSGHGGWKVRGAVESTRGRWWSLNQIDDVRWEISRGRSGTAASGRRIRRRLEAWSLEDAVERAEELLFGEVSTPERAEDLRPDQVTLMWASTKEVSASTMESYDTGIECWLRWLQARGVAAWCEISPGHVEDYLAELRGQGKARNTVRIRLVPIKQVSAWAARRWGFRDFAKGFRVVETGDSGETKVFWSLKFVGAFLGWLRRQPAGWSVLAGYALQGLCGMRVTEVLRLRWEDVDLRRGTVRIRHGKNRQSRRTLPLPALALAILEEAATRRIGALVVDRIGGEYRRGTYGRQFGRYAEAWGKGPPMPCSDLRNTLPTVSKRAGWYGYALERYIGHRMKGTVTEVNYEADVDDTMVRQFRAEVVEHIDAELSIVERKWRGSGEARKVVPIRGVS